jgi:hypothetical protein
MVSPKIQQPQSNAGVGNLVITWTECGEKLSHAFPFNENVGHDGQRRRCNLRLQPIGPD